MTAIAFDGTTLAVDCAQTSNEVRSVCHKISLLKGHAGTFIAALCGSCAFIGLVEDYFNEPFKPDYFPDVTTWHKNGRGECFGLMFNVNSRVMKTLSGTGDLIKDESPIISAGYCYTFLHGAMVSGRSAVDAVALAHVYSDGAGMGVDYIHVHNFCDELAFGENVGLAHFLTHMNVVAAVERAVEINPIRSLA